MLVDVRDPDKYAAGSFKTAVNIPTDELEKKTPYYNWTALIRYLSGKIESALRYKRELLVSSTIF